MNPNHLWARPVHGVGVGYGLRNQDGSAAEASGQVQAGAYYTFGLGGAVATGLGGVALGLLIGYFVFK